jgi:hypothetical protein
MAMIRKIQLNNLLGWVIRKIIAAIRKKAPLLVICPPYGILCMIPTLSKSRKTPYNKKVIPYDR